LGQLFVFSGGNSTNFATYFLIHKILDWKKEKEKTQLCAAVFFYPQKIIDKNFGIFFS